MELSTNFSLNPLILKQDRKTPGSKSFHRALSFVKGKTGMRINLLIMLLLAVCLQASAAANFVTGRVVDADTKEPMVSATVTIKGIGKNTTTGLDGTFKIDVSGVDNPVLIISFVGYVIKEVPVSGKSNLGQIDL